MPDNAATDDLVDRVAEAMAGIPMNGHYPEDEEAWRANARTAISAVEDWLKARSLEERANADRTRRTIPGESGRSYATNQLRNANGLAGAAAQLRKHRTRPPEATP